MRCITTLILVLGFISLHGQISDYDLIVSQMGWNAMVSAISETNGEPDNTVTTNEECIVELVWLRKFNDHTLDSICKPCSELHLSFYLIPHLAIVEKFYLMNLNHNATIRLLEYSFHSILGEQLDMKYIDDDRSAIREVYTVLDLDNMQQDNVLLYLYKRHDYYYLIEKWTLMKEFMETL